MERYDRNILVSEIGKKGQLKLLSSKVLICGAGGLGSTVIANLASVGIGKIGIIDNDVLELSNLNRQFIHKFSALNKKKAISAKKWVFEFNPDIEVEIYDLRLDEKNAFEILGKYDVIVDCFDSFKSKFLLNDFAVKLGKPLVTGGVTELNGQITTILPKKTACLRCLFPDVDLDDYAVKGVLSPVVSTIASLESMEVVKIILKNGELLANKLLVFDGAKSKFRKINLKRSEKCKLCK